MFAALVFAIISGPLFAAVLVSPTRRHARGVMDRARRTVSILVWLALGVLLMGLLTRIGW
jgi:hypothetical protein